MKIEEVERNDAYRPFFLKELKPQIVQIDNMLKRRDHPFLDEYDYSYIPARELLVCVQILELMEKVHNADLWNKFQISNGWEVKVPKRDLFDTKLIIRERLELKKLNTAERHRLKIPFKIEMSRLFQQLLQPSIEKINHEVVEYLFEDHKFNQSLQDLFNIEVCARFEHPINKIITPKICSRFDSYRVLFKRIKTSRNILNSNRFGNTADKMLLRQTVDLLMSFLYYEYLGITSKFHCVWDPKRGIKGMQDDISALCSEIDKSLFIRNHGIQQAMEEFCQYCDIGQIRDPDLIRFLTENITTI